MKFHKYHGLGNDYIVIDPAECSVPMTKENIRLICHRNFGAGSDGILHGPVIEDGVFRMRILNPDGSEAEKSGNGIRIFARYLLDKGYTDGPDFTIRTLGGDVSVHVISREPCLLRVGMGRVTFTSNEIPVSGPVREVVDEDLQLSGETVKATCVSIGNPHCVIPVEKVTEEYAREIGSEVENHLSFPNRINMQILEVVDRSTIKIEIWERGAGYTLASGSSSSAAACAARRLGLVDDDVTVKMPGGELQIQIADDWSVTMTGPVEKVYSGELDGEMEAHLNS